MQKSVKILAKSVFFTLLLFTFFSASGAISIFAANFKGIGVLPANPNPRIPFSDSWFIYNLVPGETKKDAVLISNNTGETIKLKLYAVDGTTTTDGAFALMNEENPRVSVGSWVKFSQNSVTLAPNAAKKINFAISIPNNIASGDHVGGIIAENTKIQQGETINVKTRIGARIYQTVPGELIKKLVLTNVKWSVTKNQKIAFSFDLTNKGNLRIEPTGKLTLKNKLIGQKDEFPFDLRMVLPDKNTTVPVIWEKTPLIAQVNATADITYGTKPSEKIRYELSFFYINKWVKIGLIVLTVVLVLIFLNKTATGKKHKK